MKLINEIIEVNRITCFAGLSGSGTTLILKELVDTFDGIYIDLETTMINSEQIIELSQKKKKIIFLDSLSSLIARIVIDENKDNNVMQVGQHSRYLDKFIRKMAANNVKIVFSIKSHMSYSTKGNTYSIPRKVTYMADSVFIMEKRRNNLFNIKVDKNRNGMLAKNSYLYKNLDYCFELKRFLSVSDKHKASFIKSLKKN